MKIFRLIFFLMIPLSAISQDKLPEKNGVNCESLLKEAQGLFEAGSYDQVLSNLEESFHSCSFSIGDKQRVYVLMIQSQIEKENEGATDSLVQRLLKLNPNYALTDPEVISRFNSAIKRYHVRPAFIIGGQVGYNLPFAHIETVYSILEDADYSQEYSAKPGIIAGLHLEWLFLPRFSIVIDPYTSRLSYERTISGERDFSLKFTEQMINYSGTALLKYTYSNKKMRYSIVGGYNYTKISKANADVELSYTAYNSITQLYDPYQQAANKIDLMASNLRIRNMNSWVVGAGIAYQQNNFIFSIDARYHYSTRNLVNQSERYSNSLLVYDYYYVDNDFDINRLEFTGGISYILFHKISRKVK